MKNCIVCEGKALMYCYNDDAYFCKPCDEQVHTANAIAARHQRVPLCELCSSSPSKVFCQNDKAYLCSGCDESSHQGFLARHTRVPIVEAETLSPGDSASKVSDVPAESEGDSLFQVPEMPMMVPPGVEFPEWNDISGPLDAKALLGHDFSADLDIFDADPTWLDRLDMGFDSLSHNMLDAVVPEQEKLGKQGSGKNEFVQNLLLPSLCEEDSKPSFTLLDAPQQPQATPLPDLYDPTLQFDFAASPFISEQHTRAAPAKSMFVPERAAVRYESTQDIASFVPPSLRPVDAQTRVDRALDRRMRLERYREKKKNRQFKKTIRYASRKAYAEVRPRVKGRFARKDEVAAMRSAGMLPCA